MSDELKAQFKTKTGRPVRAVTTAQLAAVREQLLGRFGIRTAQLVEASSYSFAMVVRYALGLSATDGEVLCLFNSSLRGFIALATARHLVNAGSRVHLFRVADSRAPDPELAAQLAMLEALNLPLAKIVTNQDVPAFLSRLEQSHNVICGLDVTGEDPSPTLSLLVEQMNESRTPVHSVECPVGIDADTGARIAPHALFSSSTLSLGAPLSGLFHGHTYVGRHYLCDNSIPATLYAPVAPLTNTLFAEQPVLQILPDDPPDLVEVTPPG